ncbi:uncharacterized protein MELLADRAFT_64360 [Melampsora larici-populina 98AG31]|uniref:Uncharacterized protein n=1 Tax=Melampsora larici-populina (strain 98AG31 / pathotype 3-4-7) TaxID=747676 RepID=F4RR57_MELLP|nr:uncharacterized protein MELLADRAFT_64360 [Melampsora larici-populina 98AG31]EGG05208.1 hypothetical protein MELLADRAFT_64360 [Melampsora larici-populina 98AG31]
MTDDELMDSYSVTPVCLRVALALGNTIGVIPCELDDPRVQAEQAREEAAGFPKCQCSNCDSISADMLVYNLPRLTKSNYEDAMRDVFSVEGFWKRPEGESEDIDTQEDQVTTRKKASKKHSGPLDSALEALAQDLVSVFDSHCTEVYGEHGYFESTDYFDLDQTRKMLRSIDEIQSPEDIKLAMGGDIVKGGVNIVFNYIDEWKKRDAGLDYSRNQARILERKKAAEEKRMCQESISLNRHASNSTAITTSTTMKATVAINTSTTMNATDRPINKKIRRSSAQVKADREAARLKKEYNARCLNWLRVEKVLPSELDAKEQAYQESVSLFAYPSNKILVKMLKLITLFGFSIVLIFTFIWCVVR